MIKTDYIMKTFSCILLQLVLSLACITSHAQTTKNILPTPQQVAWSNAEIGVIIHLDINLYAPDFYHSGDSTTLLPLSAFRPDKLNTDQWIRAAKAAGAKYAVFVAKHGTGFANWPSKANDYNVGHTPWRDGKENIVADFVKSCKKYGIKPGVYYSVNSSTLYEASDHMSDSARTAYNKIVLEQEKELWTEYGKWFEIWFDGGILPTSKGGVSDQLAAMIKKYQPQAILFQGPSSSKNLIRWVGNEYGNAPYPMWCRDDSTTSSHGYVTMENLNGDPDGDSWVPAESDFPSRKKSAWEGGWFWRANREQDVVSLDSLVNVYYHTVGRNTNLLIGMAIDTAGLFPEKETHLFEAFGKEIRKRFSHPIAQTKGAGKEFILKLGKHPMAVNQIVIMEEIAKGQNIRQYTVEAWENNQWQKVCSGISVGHQRIQTFPTIHTEKLRLKILESSQTPDIKKFAAYFVE
jgi:alpha-L-fucosidase